MAPKRSNDPLASSSWEEEETSSNEEKEGSYASDEEVSQETRSAKRSDSESDSESDQSDSEEDNDSGVKPEHMDETPAKSAKPNSKPALKSSGAASGKRVNEADLNPKDSKRMKKKMSENDVAAGKSKVTKKQLFERLWSEEDEIVVLKGIIDFAEKKGVDPSKNLRAFFDFIKKSVHFPATLLQLRSKVRKLRKKFENHASGELGENKTFAKSHDQKLFDLSKIIWGVKGCVKPSNLVKSKKKVNHNGGSEGVAELVELAVDEKEAAKAGEMVSSGFLTVAGVGAMEEYVLRESLEMVDDAKKAELEGKWRKLLVAELELFVKKNELISEQAKLILAALKNE